MGASDIRAGGAFVELFAKDQALGVGLNAAQNKLKHFAQGFAASMAFAANSGDRSLKGVLDILSTLAIQAAFAKGNMVGLAATASIIAISSVAQWSNNIAALRDEYEKLAGIIKKAGNEEESDTDKRIRLVKELKDVNEWARNFKRTDRLNPWGLGEADMEKKRIQAQRELWELNKKITRENIAASKAAEAKAKAEQLSNVQARVNSAMKLDVAGSFSAAGLDRMGFGKSLADRQLKATEQTAEACQKILDAIKNGDFTGGYGQ